jgi:GAF domain-containing protein
MSGEVIPRALVGVPLLRAGAPIGAIVLARYAPGEFSTTQIELLRTFAEQAVIAITSAETFTELQRRTAELTRSVAELQALEEVLRAVNSSLELETVLSTIISRAVQLSDADEGTIYEFDDADQVFVPKSAYGMTAERVTALRDRRIRIGETPLGNSAAMRAPLHIPDLTQTLDLDGSRELVGDGIHALLAVPLLRDDKVLGGLVIRRRAVGGFTPHAGSAGAIGEDGLARSAHCGHCARDQEPAQLRQQFFRAVGRSSGRTARGGGAGQARHGWRASHRDRRTDRDAEGQSGKDR